MMLVLRSPNEQCIPLRNWWRRDRAFTSSLKLMEAPGAVQPRVYEVPHPGLECVKVTEIVEPLGSCSIVFHPESWNLHSVVLKRSRRRVAPLGKLYLAITFVVSWLGVGWCYQHLLGRVRDTAKHPTMDRAAPTINKELSHPKYQ